MPEATPIRDKIRVEVLPQAERSKVLHTIERETPLRRCRIEALGPDANARKSPKLSVGQIILCNILSGQAFDASLIVPASAVVATLEQTTPP